MSNSDEHTRSMKVRPYEMRKRLEDVEETRRRIVEAAARLHGSVGPARTTVSAVAEAAEVQRSTVYRHFPDDEALFRACTGHWLAEHPWPDPRRWRGVADPAERLSDALAELYAYYGANRSMLRNSYRDAEAMPAFVAAGRAARLEEMHRALAAGWGLRGRRRARLQAAITHALDFRTCESLTEAGLSPAEAAELMVDMVTCGRGG